MSKPNVEIVIITKDRSEYVDALLEYEGISPEKIKSNVVIYDFSYRRLIQDGDEHILLPVSTDDKGLVVRAHENHKPIANMYEIYDNNDNDCKAIVHELIKRGAQSKIAVICNNPSDYFQSHPTTTAKNITR